MTGPRLFSRPDPEIEMDQTATVLAGAQVLDVARCLFDQDGHRWVETTTIGQLTRSWVCHCGAIGKERE